MQNDPGGPPANLHPDLDHGEDLSKEESVEPAPPIDPDTHISSKSRKQEPEKLEAWDVLVEAHTEKTKAVYGLPPMPPDLKRDQRQALAECLDGAAVEVQAKLHARTGLDRKLTEMRRELALRVMQLYFKRDNEHLRRVKHALRDLPREFHARLTEAMQLILRESHDATPPRRVQLEQPLERVASVDKPVETTQQKQHEEPIVRIESVDKPVEVVALKASEPVESVDKPVEVVASKASERSSQPPQASMNTAREARRILEALNATTPQQDLFKPSKRETQKIEPATRPVLPASVDKPAQDKPSQKSFELKKFEDKPSRAAHVERPLGRLGAPRWGVMGPRPTKVRRVSKLSPDEVESDEKLGVCTTASD